LWESGKDPPTTTFSSHPTPLNFFDESFHQQNNTLMHGKDHRILLGGLCCGGWYVVGVSHLPTGSVPVVEQVLVAISFLPGLAIDEKPGAALHKHFICSFRGTPRTQYCKLCGGGGAKGFSFELGSLVRLENFRSGTMTF
jgi:hypothetical protein